MQSRSENLGYFIRLLGCRFCAGRVQSTESTEYVYWYRYRVPVQYKPN